MRWAFPLGVALVALSCASGSRHVVRDEDSERIEATMKPEAFSADLPAARGIALGADAPPLAPPFPDRPTSSRRITFRFSNGMRRGLARP